MPSRRDFLTFSAAAVSAGFLGLHRLFADATTQPATNPAVGYGPLIPDPKKILDLPAGFSHHVFSQVGQMMDDTLRVPGLHDGMAAFAGPADGTVIIVRNHEVMDRDKNGAFGANNELLSKISQSKLYDAGHGRPCLGGTTTLVYNTRDRMLE